MAQVTPGAKTLVQVVDLGSDVNEIAGVEQDHSLAALTRAAYIDSIQRCRGNMSKVSEELGVDRRTVYRYVRVEGLVALVRSVRELAGVPDRGLRDEPAEPGT